MSGSYNNLEAQTLNTDIIRNITLDSQTINATTVNATTVNATTINTTGILPTYVNQSVNPCMFGSSSDSQMGLVANPGTAPNFYAPATIPPWPCLSSNLTFTPTIPYILGSVPFTLVAGDYAINM